MPDLQDLALEHFSGRVGESFSIYTPEEVQAPAEAPFAEQPRDHLMDVVLTQAQGLGEGSAGQRTTPFSLLFRGPSERILPQGIYRFDNAGMGAFDLFIVPLQPDSEGSRYEAIFT